MYKIKQTPEDFVVEEIIELELADDGDYVYFWLNKKGFTTANAIEKISRFIRCKLRDIGFAGNKDKQAITKQAISIKDPGKRISKTRFEKFNSEKIFLEYIGRGKKPISLGDLEGNRFEIVLRECEKEPENIKQFINYFDEQRFSETNKDVGKAIVKGDFKKACGLINAEEVKAHLEKNQNDFVGAMKRLPLKTRLLHIHAYQSWLWNETVKEYLQSRHKDLLKQQYSLGELVFPKSSIEAEAVPIIGFGTEIGTDEIGKIIKQIMEKEEITQRDFIIRSMPELSAEGGERELAVEIADIGIEKIGEKEYKIKFFLPKASYATMAIKRMMIQ